MGTRAVLSGYFLLTMVMTAMISNQATAAILASIAIEMADVLDVAARPFLMAITFAASLSFITPWGIRPIRSFTDRASTSSPISRRWACRST